MAKKKKKLRKLKKKRKSKKKLSKIKKSKKKINSSEIIFKVPKKWSIYAYIIK